MAEKLIIAIYENIDGMSELLDISSFAIQFDGTPS